MRKDAAIKTLFQHNQLSFIRFAIFFSIALSILFADHHLKKLEMVRDAFSFATYTLSRMVVWPLDTFDKINHALTRHNKLLKQNHQLQINQLLLEAQVQRYAALERENRQLRVLLNSSPPQSNKFLVAQLISIAMEPMVHQIILDRGREDGVYVGQPVLDAKGVVGQVLSVEKHFSRVLLLNDRSSAIPVELSRSGLRAIVVGTGLPNKLRLNHVPSTTDVRVNDVLLTSGLGQRFPQGFPVGVVSNIKHKPGDHFSTITVKPTAELNQSRLMLLVWPKYIPHKHSIKSDAS